VTDCRENELYILDELKVSVTVAVVATTTVDCLPFV
jgi:hypothetical protein